jgi:hypothetical protein
MTADDMTRIVRMTVIEGWRDSYEKEGLAGVAVYVMKSCLISLTSVSLSHDCSVIRSHFQALYRVGEAAGTIV